MESGSIDVLMFSVNPCYDLQPAGENCEALWAEESYAGMLVNMDPARERLYETCQRLGVGITVMKAFGGGDLLSAALSPAGKALTIIGASWTDNAFAEISFLSSFAEPASII